MSKFKKHEVIGYLIIDGKKVTYLKMGVKRQYRYQDYISYEYIDHINHQLHRIKKYGEYLKKVVGIDDYEKM
jgi:hypothetical protein